MSRSRIHHEINIIDLECSWLKLVAVPFQHLSDNTSLSRLCQTHATADATEASTLLLPIASPLGALDTHSLKQRRHAHDSEGLHRIPSQHKLVHSNEKGLCPEMMLKHASGWGPHGLANYKGQKRTEKDRKISREGINRRGAKKGRGGAAVGHLLGGHEGSPD